MIKNLTKKTTLAHQVTFATTILQQAWGLMFQNPKPLILSFSSPRKVSIHMLFCFWSLDILVVDAKKKVVEIKKTLKPFTFYTPKFEAKYIIELPSGSIATSKTTIGDQLQF